MESGEVSFLIEHDYKVPGGKLLRIKMELEGELITSIQILGDFFLHPEETIIDIEDSLVNMNLDPEGLLRSVNSAMSERSAKLIGAKPEDIVAAILSASSETE
ncbi:hypothetical protein EU545_05670 [Candidatus Thorarchaeota archaeon]|nr:MAG: hypothetical protein EU545_05670 [Candidatus Thorarchaeota archaeon]